MRRQKAESIGEIFGAILGCSWLGPAMERVEVFKAWDEAVGERTASLSRRKFYKDGILTVTFSSSMVRSVLMHRTGELRETVNITVSGAPDGPVQKIILR